MPDLHLWTGRITAVSALAAVCLAAGAVGHAHKPITSPYTFNDDVFPIVRERCGRCHVTDGVAPMSLMTHQEAVPWGEAIRMELIAGHMPPGSVDTSPGRFRNVEGLTARELNLLLTWAAGGTPLGTPEKAPEPVSVQRAWPLGDPDVVLPMPAEYTLAEDAQEATAEFTLPTGIKERRWLRAIDLMPGTPAIVRQATVLLAAGGEPSSDATFPERLLALWLPGDPPVALDAGLGFPLPAASELVLRIHYRKTWQYERMEMTDRSTVGLYFADAPASDVEALLLAAGPDARGDQAAGGDRLAFSRVVEKDVQALAIYPAPDLAHVGLRVDAVRPDGSREELIAFRPQPHWARRYWFAEPIALPRGTRINVSSTWDDEGALLPPGATPPPDVEPDLARLRLTLNVVSK